METSCPICFEEYNLSTRLPRVTLVCGHSFCSPCLANLIKEQGTPKCPLDKINLPATSDIEKFPINYPLRAIIEGKQQADVCPDHGEQLICICLVDHKKICMVCVEEEHQGHQVRSFKSMKMQIDKQTNELGELSKKAKQTHKEADSIIMNRMEMQLETIDKDYEELFQVLQYRKQCIKSQARLLFYFEQSKAEDLLGDNSLLFTDLNAQKEQLQDILKQNNFLKYNDSNFLISDLEDRYKVIANSDIKNPSMNEELNLIQDSVESIVSYGKLVPSIKITKFEKLLEKFSLKSFLKFTYNESCLLIEMSKDAKLIEIDLKTWMEAQEIKFCFTQQIKINESDLALITAILDSLKDHISLKLKFATGTLTQELSSLFINCQHEFKKLEIDIYGYKIEEQSPTIPFIRNMFLKAKNIEGVSLLMSGITTTKDGLIEKIFKGGIFDTTNLREFSLKLNKPGIKDKDISDIFVPMPKLVKYDIDLDETKISDETLKSLSRNTLSSATVIERLIISAARTPISHIGISEILKEVKSKLKELALKLRSAEMTDQTLDILSEDLSRLDLYESLEKFVLGFSLTKISEASLIKMLRPMPNLLTLILGVEGTEMTDKVIHHIIQTYLQSKNILAEFYLLAGNTGITEEGVSPLLKELRKVKRIDLDLQNLWIGDKVIESFVDELSSPESICQKLDLNLSGTNVTIQLKSKVTEAIEQISKRNAN